MSDLEAIIRSIVNDEMTKILLGSTTPTFQHGGPLAHTTLTQHTNDGRCCTTPVLHEEPRG